MLLVHTADWQLGLKAGQVGDRAADLRERRFAAAQRVVELAHAREADLLLLAGDTFDHPDVDERVVARAVEIFAAADPIPVAVLPGNHDPLVSGGVWRRASWRRIGDHVHLLDRPIEVEILPGVALYPCPLTQKQSRRDPTAWIPTRERGDERLRIGVAHGSLTSLGVAENFPIAADRAQQAGLDYLALGDWHGLSVGEREAYPGTVEATSFSERDPGHVLLVGLAAGPAGERPPPAIEAVEVAALHWISIEAEARHATDLAALDERLRALGAPGALLLRLSLRLRGAAAAELWDAAAALRVELEESCFFSEVELAIEGGESVDLPAGLLSRVDGALAAVLAGGDAADLGAGCEAVLAGADPSVVRRARQLLQQLAGSETRNDGDGAAS
jgi:hypothetical protein